MDYVYDKTEKDIDYIFNLDSRYEDTLEERIELLRDKDIKRYRLKTIISGEFLESEAYPIWNTSKRKINLKAKREVTPEEERVYTHKKRKKRIVRLMNANFTGEDIWITFGYKGYEEPEDIEEAKKDIKNYLRRLKRYIKKNNLPDLKYIYVVEVGEQSGKKHIHLVMNFRDRDMAEKLWHKGKYPQARRLQPDVDSGLDGLSGYLSKDIKGQKSYGYSLNLKKTWQKPYVKTADSKMSRAKVEKLATERLSPRQFYEKMYPGWEFIEMETRYSKFTTGAYLYAKMRKRQ